MMEETALYRAGMNRRMPAELFRNLASLRKGM
jgi:hypothetical protein